MLCTPEGNRQGGGTSRVCCMSQQRDAAATLGRCCAFFDIFFASSFCVSIVVVVFFCFFLLIIIYFLLCFACSLLLVFSSSLCFFRFHSILVPFPFSSFLFLIHDSCVGMVVCPGSGARLRCDNKGMISKCMYGDVGSVCGGMVRVGEDQRKGDLQISHSQRHKTGNKAEARTRRVLFVSPFVCCVLFSNFRHFLSFVGDGCSPCSPPPPLSPGFYPQWNYCILLFGRALQR